MGKGILRSYSQLRYRLQIQQQLDAFQKVINYLVN